MYLHLVFMVHPILGSSLVYINEDWKLKHVAMFGLKFTQAHDAESVSKCLDEAYMERYQFDISTSVKFIMSDTAG